MRLIDADAIAPKLEGTYNQTMVRYAPKIDAVPVVRCKDCKYRDGTPGQPNILCGNMHDDDFCNYGERKDEANEP